MTFPRCSPSDLPPRKCPPAQVQPDPARGASAAGRAPEEHGYIGERYDGSSGLQYLNARYYDPELGLFTSPDWFDVTHPGVGTNRYAYALNDPINLSDPSGNVAVVPIIVGGVVLAYKVGNVVWTTHDTYNTPKDLIDPETRGAAVRQMGQDWALAATIGKPVSRGLSWIGKKGSAGWAWFRKQVEDFAQDESGSVKLPG